VAPTLRQVAENPLRVEVSPAALAFANRVTQEQFEDVYFFAHLVDQIAEEARTNERKRIFSMSFREIFAEFWKGRKLYAP
jgi:hypothetical protein